jgi:hypothetical protein
MLLLNRLEEMQNKIAPRIFDTLTGQEHHPHIDSHLTEVPLVPLQADRVYTVGVDHTFLGCNNVSDCIFTWLSQNLALRCRRLRKDDVLDQKGEHKLPDFLALQQLR